MTVGEVHLEGSVDSRGSAGGPGPHLGPPAPQASPGRSDAGGGSGHRGVGRLEYRPGLDGLRTIAVFLVLGFHSGISQLTGGFIGVDVFFVLSGYLVTRLIVGDLATDRFRLLDFYSRRIRRLLPAALSVLAVVSVLWLLLASPVDRANILPDVRSAALYYSNWHFAAQATDYFALNNDPSPVLHFWSLSVEEQFYAGWPLLVLIIWIARRRQLQAALITTTVVAGVLSVGSLVALFLTLRAHQSDLAYYGTDTRVYQLLGGAILGIGVQAWRWAALGTLAKRCAVGLQVAALLALGVLVTPMLDLDPSVRGIGAAVASIALLWSLEVCPDQGPSQILRSAPLVYLGQISYGIYLWHYPVIVVLRRFLQMNPVLLFVIAAVLSTALAALSQRALELPIRRTPRLARRRRTVIVSGLAISLVGALVLFPLALNSTTLPRITAVSAGGVATAAADRISMAGIDLVDASTLPAGTPGSGPEPKDTTCTKGPVSQCILVHGTGAKVLVIGDSHALMLMPALRQVAVYEKWTLAIAATTGCPWATGLAFVESPPGVCAATKKIWYSSVVHDFDPDLIILVSRASDHPPQGYYVRSDSPSVTGTTQSQLMISADTQTLKKLSDEGRKVVVFEPVPVSLVNSTSCLSAAKFADECSFRTDPNRSPADLAMESAARTMPGIHSVNIAHIACPRFPLCDAMLGGAVVRKDHDHFTSRYAAGIAQQLDVVLRQSGALGNLGRP